MSDTPTDKKLSERFDAILRASDFVTRRGDESIVSLTVKDGELEAVLAALRLAESHPSAIRARGEEKGK